ncbi:hybrid sensor histidine kinase/response regulator [Roseicella aquatilis]|uniref:histidine kinase n=1 Tax=Roseicella aquatilis TaxID=2527868 RepID=A0A4R4DVM2_9PROT|nr:hybrid sensor histidine kinase/response regulator [Roseicella aquatilis]TCZ66615.1 sensor histidine kinase [Roseicella aquatilis]
MTAAAASRQSRLGGLRGEVGSEQEMSVNRLAFALVFLAYLLTLGAPVRDAGLPLLALWGAGAAAIALHIRWRPGPSTPRRTVALLLDTGVLSGFLHLGGAHAAPFFPVYLWVALGNGFRFGPRWLLLGMAAFLLGFGAVALTTPYWRALPHLTVGLLVGPLVLAIYAATLIRKLSQARLAAEQASAAKTRFLAGMSHELRTPLNAIIGMGGLLRATPLDREQQEMARTIEAAGRSLLTQINSLLDISRIEAGAAVTRSERVDLAALLAEVRGLLLAQAREKGLLLRLHVTPRTPTHVLGDPAALRDILLNLGGNAVKFTAAGGVTIAADAEPAADGRVRLRLEVSDTGIGISEAAQARIFERFAQADESIPGRFGGTGLGLTLCKGLAELLGGEIAVRSRPGEGSCFRVLLPVVPAGAAAPAAALQALLLSPDAAGVEAVAGCLAGCGVAVTPQPVAPAAYAAFWGGEGTPPAMLLAFAPPGELPAPEDVAAALRGAGPVADLPVFALDDGVAPGLPDRALRQRVAGVLPRSATAADWAMPLALADALLPRGAAPAGPAAPATAMRVLVADDNRVNRLVVQKILERAGHAVTLVCDGEAALDALEAGEFDLALMDLNMPGTDGITATKLYRFHALGRKHLPILGLTADATPEAARRCREAGMDACLVKPIEPAQLVAAVAEHAPRRAPVDATPEMPVPAPAPVLAEAPAAPALDPAVTADLVALGGRRFVLDLTRDFVADAGDLLRSLEEAAGKGDVAQFRAAAHALRSSAANIGARGLFALGSEAEAMPAERVITGGRDQVDRLAAELERVRIAGRKVAEEMA